MEVRVDGREGVVPMPKHEGAEVVGNGGSLDAEVGEHGVGLPAAKHFDVVTVHVGAEEGSGPAGPERPGGELRERDGVVTGTAVEFHASMAEGVGDRFGRDVFPGVFGAVEEGGKAEARMGFPPAEFAADAEESKDRAHLGVPGAAVTNNLSRADIRRLAYSSCALRSTEV